MTFTSFRAIGTAVIDERLFNSRFAELEAAFRNFKIRVVLVIQTKFAGIQRPQFRAGGIDVIDTRFELDIPLIHDRYNNSIHEPSARSASRTGRSLNKYQPDSAKE